MFPIDVLRMRNPIVAGPSWRTGTTDTLSSNNNGNSGYTNRQLIKASVIPYTSTKIRMRFQAGGGQGLELDHVYVGLKGAGDVDFASAPTEVLFGGVSGFTLTVHNTTAQSDDLVFSRASTDDIVISAYGSNASYAQYREYVGATTKPWKLYYKHSNDPTSLVASGYTQWETTANHLIIDLIEVYS